jgi:Tfp pilus assembly protein PilN
MIRINLLEQPRPRQTRPPGTSKLLIVASAFLGGALISLAYLGITYQISNRKLASVQQQIVALNVETTRLQQVVIEIRELRLKRAKIQAQLEAVRQLSSSRAGGEELLSKLAGSVVQADGLWLTSFQRKGSVVSMQGQAASMVEVANLITALRLSGYFTQVEISETKEDDSNASAVTYSFNMTAQVSGPIVQVLLTPGKS